MTKRSPSQYFDPSGAKHIQYLQIAKTIGRSPVVELKSDRSIQTIEPH